MSIYVEILIRGNMDDLWQKTQEPKLHGRWDLRFSQIDYLPRPAGEAQKFLYSTRIGAGLQIRGQGESTGERDDSSGQRTSALKFWSKDPKSLIEFGSGYWQYVPDERGIRFLTAYDYRTRFGVLGKIVDWLVFRPLIGWATAWSFDRLRLWIEEGIPPEVSRDRALIYGVSRLTIAFIWLYHGAVPKLLYHNPDEIRMLTDAGVSQSHLLTWISLFGWLEVSFSLILIIFWRARWPLWCTIAAMFAATSAVGINSPPYLTAAFNPLTLNLAVAVLAAIGLLVAGNLPTAKNCRRRPREN
ncbi:MAG TPA: DoxX-like family protein [Candidatus Acidoferrales bacterium]|nr:DoxX-like family protein [Candidatus Acidoferrales bacterium]